MSRRRGMRVLGPYADARGWRVVEVDAAGKRSSVMFETEARALRHIEIMQAELVRGDRTTETALPEYKLFLATKGTICPRKQASIDLAEWAIGEFFPQPLALTELTPKKCGKLYDELCARPTKRGTPRSVDTQRVCLREAKAFIAWCYAQGWVGKVNPMSGVKGIGRLKRRGKSKGIDGKRLFEDDARRVYVMAQEMAGNGDEGAIAVLLAMVLGMRAGEIVRIQVRQINSGKERFDKLWIEESKTESGERPLAIPPVLRPFLIELAKGKEPTDWLFPGRAEGTHRYRDWVRKNVWRVCVAAGVARANAHAMRHLLADLAAEGGTAGYLVAAHLGHSSESVTRTSYASPGAFEAGARRNGLTLIEGGLGKSEDDEEPAKSTG